MMLVHGGAGAFWSKAATGLPSSLQRALHLVVWLLHSLSNFSICVEMLWPYLLEQAVGLLLLSVVDQGVFPFFSCSVLAPEHIVHCFRFRFACYVCWFWKWACIHAKLCFYGQFPVSILSLPHVAPCVCVAIRCVAPNQCCLLCLWSTGSLLDETAYLFGSFVVSCCLCYFSRYHSFWGVYQNFCAWNDCCLYSTCTLLQCCSC